MLDALDHIQDFSTSYLQMGFPSAPVFHDYHNSLVSLGAKRS